MHWRTVLIPVGVALGVAACSSGATQEWMKINQEYTVAEFRRDYEACSKRGKLDDACMQAKGWVPVSPSKPEKPPEPYSPADMSRTPIGTSTAPPR